MYSRVNKSSALFLLFSLAACSSSNENTTPTSGADIQSSTGIGTARIIARQDDPTTCPANVSAPMTTDGTTDYILNVEIIGPSDSCLPQENIVNVQLFGFDEFVADTVANSLLGEWKKIAWQGDDYFQVGFNDADWINVEPQSGGENALFYYIHIESDLNGDGNICNGDLVRDFDVSPELEFFSSSQKLALLSIQMKTIDDVLCDS